MREARLWLLQLLSGALIFFVLGAHLTLMRLRSILSFFGLPIEDPVAWDSMIQRAHSSLWLAFYIILLALVLYHGLYGLRNILLELSLSPAAARRISTALIAVGLAAFIFGTYVPVKLFLS